MQSQPELWIIYELVELDSLQLFSKLCSRQPASELLVSLLSLIASVFPQAVQSQPASGLSEKLVELDSFKFFCKLCSPSQLLSYL